MLSNLGLYPEHFEYYVMTLVSHLNPLVNDLVGFRACVLTSLVWVVVSVSVLFP